MADAVILADDAASAKIILIIFYVLCVLALLHHHDPGLNCLPKGERHRLDADFNFFSTNSC